ncbi:hypothetical protein [Helicobacter ailurogastricus]|uniref:Uncharacterized protein n=1 Tax=Helicobacter ailurogastricus TaxID=1578720 RepID=A0A0K2Y7D1_9HELI|nr:hypothetical protein [Helicobacter ailurogastricus]BDQ28962.1 hypothetical protein ASB7_07990 [Helicobacter ailurogastricus]CRI32470.1 hypothetical protein HAL07_09450 [Helicobacter ailurogastricus]
MGPDISAGRGAVSVLAQNISNLAQAHSHLANVVSSTQGHLANMANKYHNLALSTAQFSYQKEKDAKEQEHRAAQLSLEQARLDLANRQQDIAKEQWEKTFGFNQQQAKRNYGLAKQQTAADVGLRWAQVRNLNADTGTKGYILGQSADPSVMALGNKLLTQAGGGFKGNKPALKKPLETLKDPTKPPAFDNPMQRP